MQTEEEVFAALEECGLSDKKKQVKRWYDGFTFGAHTDIYNPWSILNFLDKGKFTTYWANTSSNSLVGKLLREGNRKVKEKFEQLLSGGEIESAIDEQIVYNRLDGNERALWSLLLASGYLKVLSFEKYGDIPEGTNPVYQLALTNLEVKLMFQNMIHDWFAEVEEDYNDFISAMLSNDTDAMEVYMNRVTQNVFSYFDTRKRLSGGEPEKKDAYILEFKVFNPKKEKSLDDTVAVALQQIEEKQYATALIEKGIPKERIRSYGFAFEGKSVLIG